MDRFTSAVLDFFQAAFAKEEKSRGWASIAAIRGSPGVQQTASLRNSVSVARYSRPRRTYVVGRVS